MNQKKDSSKERVNGNKKVIKKKLKRKPRNKQVILKELMIQELAKNPIIQSVCQKIGVGKSTYYRWVAEDHEFDQRSLKAIIHGNDVVNDLAKSQLIVKIKEKDTKSIFYWLNHRHPEFIHPQFAHMIPKKENGALSIERKTQIVKSLKRWKNQFGKPKN